jgi:hypothetical protein
LKLYRKDLAREYGVELRTIDRWKCDGTLPKPRRMKRPHWTPEQLQKAEMVNAVRFDEEKVRRAARLRKHRQFASAKQFSLPFQYALPIK